MSSKPRLALCASAAALVTLVETRGLESTGQFLNYDGRPIPW